MEVDGREGSEIGIQRESIGPGSGEEWLRRERRRRRSHWNIAHRSHTHSPHRTKKKKKKKKNDGMKMEECSVIEKERPGRGEWGGWVWLVMVAKCVIILK